MGLEVYVVVVFREAGVHCLKLRYSLEARLSQGEAELSVVVLDVHCAMTGLVVERGGLSFWRFVVRSSRGVWASGVVGFTVNGGL